MRSRLAAPATFCITRDRLSEFGSVPSVLPVIDGKVTTAVILVGVVVIVVADKVRDVSTEVEGEPPDPNPCPISDEIVQVPELVNAQKLTEIC
jgi:hypothetical protein